MRNKTLPPKLARWRATEGSDSQRRCSLGGGRKDAISIGAAQQRRSTTNALHSVPEGREVRKRSTGTTLLQRNQSRKNPTKIKGVRRQALLERRSTSSRDCSARPSSKRAEKIREGEEREANNNLGNRD